MEPEGSSLGFLKPRLYPEPAYSISDVEKHYCCVLVLTSHLCQSPTSSLPRRLENQNFYLHSLPSSSMLHAPLISFLLI
jgi:hypothetical protein